MEAARILSGHYRVQPIREDAGESGSMFATRPPDPLDDAVSLDEHFADPPHPDWRCDDCGTTNVGPWLNCGYCGIGREDV